MRLPLSVLVAACLTAPAAAQERSLPSFLSQHCIDCHGNGDAAARLDLESIADGDFAAQAETWEKVVRKLVTRQMPPAEMPRPSDVEYRTALAELTRVLDAAAAANPRPGRTATLRRLTRFEYQNAIRDVLALDIDASSLLPADEASHGFDNTSGEFSPTLVERYITAAQKISRLALGRGGQAPNGDTFRVPADLTQEDRIEGLPIGTRGGILIPYTFVQDGEYEIQIRLTRDRNEEVEGLDEPHELEVVVDRERKALLTVTPPKTATDHQTADAHLRVRVAVSAGPHDVGVTFLKKPSSLIEQKRQPYQARFNMHRHPRTSPAIYQVSIVGPFDATGPGDTPSRRRVLVCSPAGPDDEVRCARQILSQLMRRAYRRSVTEDDLSHLLELFHQGRAGGSFESGIELALSGILVNPNFLFRIEADAAWHDPASRDRATQKVASRAVSVYPISDVELASRLSFFLWSSIPDDELLDAAIAGELSEPEELERQVRRMLADARSASLATNFAGQWLHLRNLDATTPDLRLFPDFDENLRRAMRRETELLFDSIRREDRSVLDLLRPGYTFLNERLAKHYGIPHVYGSRFRRVELDDDTQRGGLLRQAIVLTVTSYATRTSPVIRGKWVLENLLGTPPPPPPPDIPALSDDPVSASLSVRDRLAIHREDPACASCHQLTDPVGFALENFDAVGRWRNVEDGKPIDATGGLPDGSEFVGVDGLEQALLDHPEPFVMTLTEKLLTYALGRGIEHADAPAIRKIIRDAKQDDNRFSAIILGIANSTPFRMRSE